MWCDIWLQIHAFFLLFWDTRDWFQGHGIARQALYHSATPITFFSLWVSSCPNTSWRDYFSPHWMFLVSMSQIIWPKMLFYFWTLNSIQFFYMSCLMSIPNILKLWNTKLSISFVFKIIWLFRIINNFIWISGWIFSFLWGTKENGILIAIALTL